MRTSLRLPVIGPFLTGMYGFTTRTTVTSSRLAGHYDSWGTDRLNLYLLLTKFGKTHAVGAAVLIIGWMSTVHSSWTGLVVVLLLRRMPQRRTRRCRLSG